jgi:hypothetical protein
MLVAVGNSLPNLQQDNDTTKFNIVIGFIWEEGHLNSNGVCWEPAYFI